MDGPLLYSGFSYVFQETRRSQPAAYRATTQDIDYLENQCADQNANRGCDYQEYPGQDLGFGDLQITADTKDEVFIYENLLFSHIIF